MLFILMILLGAVLYFFVFRRGGRTASKIAGRASQTEGATEVGEFLENTMPTFKVYGAETETGKDVQIRVQAESPAEAEAIAIHRRIMVERVVEVEIAGAHAVVASAPRPMARMPQTAQPILSVSGHSAYAPTVNVNLPKRTSSLGVVSLILGIVALLICWIPLVGMLSIPISGLGLLLAILGVAVAIGRRGGIGWPIGGGLLAGLALLVGFSQVAVIRAIGDAEQKSQQTNQQAVAPAGMARQQTNPNTPSVEDTQQWASAVDAVRQGDIELRVTSVAVTAVKLKDGFGDGVSTSKEPQLVVGVELRNISNTKKLNYRTWAGRDFSIGHDYGTLQDNFANNYKRVTFGAMSNPVGHVESDSIYPGKSLSDVLVFEPPLDKVEYLNLELPGENIGGEGMLRIRIPASMVKR